MAPASQEQDMELLLQEWGSYWEVGSLQDTLLWPSDMGPELPPFSLDQLKKVLRSFKACSGAGYDQISPRQLLELPGETLECFRELIFTIESSFVWPELWAKVVFILMRTGGLRPIALMHATSRVQGRLGRPLIRRWQ
eukprot:9354132-Pyramimonas_sp.AAC.1